MAPGQVTNVPIDLHLTAEENISIKFIPSNDVLRMGVQYTDDTTIGKGFDYNEVPMKLVVWNVSHHTAHIKNSMCLGEVT